MAFDSELGTEAVVWQPRVSVPTPRFHATIAPPANGSAEESVRIVRPPLPKALQVTIRLHSRLIPLQTWEGFVERVDHDQGTFWARLEDLEDDATGDAEVAEFSFSDVDSDDLELVRPGGVFRWIIGYREQLYGKRERISSLVFRRLPAWSEADLAASKVEGRALADAFCWD